MFRVNTLIGGLKRTEHIINGLS